MLFIQCIWNDLKEILNYLQGGIITGFVCCIMAVLLQRNRYKDKTRFGRYFSCFLSGVYLYVFLQQAYFSRAPGSRNSINMVLGGTWGTTVQSHAYVIENIIMFIPMGIILALHSRLLRKNAGLCVFTGFMFSVALEIVQFLTERGYSQLDDIFMNTVGTLLGWLIIRILCTSS